MLGLSNTTLQCISKVFSSFIVYTKIVVALKTLETLVIRLNLLQNINNKIFLRSK